MRGEEAGCLRKSELRSVDNECHEQHGQREEFRIEAYDEERNLARGIVLGVRVRVGEG